MKTLIAVSLLLMSSITWANPLLLKCTINRSLKVFSVEDLVSNDCQSKSVIILNGQIKTRYNIMLCNGKDSEGTVEVLSSNGSWFPVEEFSTEKNCYLYRNIATNYPCQPSRHGHNGGCGGF
jgi:hypothetical protein